jgi:cold shock CspA family protein
MLLFKKPLLGVVTSYDSARGFGFVTEWISEGKPRQFFFHVSAVKDQIVLTPNDIVVFEIGPSPKRGGKIIAVKVRLAKKPEMPNSLRECFAKSAIQPPEPDVPKALVQAIADAASITLGVR